MSPKKHEFLLAIKKGAASGANPELIARRIRDDGPGVRELRLALADVGLAVTNSHVKSIGAGETELSDSLALGKTKVMAPLVFELGMQSCSAHDCG